MAKATLKLSNGTVVTLEGTPEEVHRLLELHGGAGGMTKSLPSSGEQLRRQGSKPKAGKGDEGDKPDLTEIVTLVKDCDEAEPIETQILDRASQVNRALLPLYIVHEYLQNSFGLTSGDVMKVTTDLGIPIAQPNASRTLSGTASKYVIGDKVKVKGQTVRYRLSRRGVKYMKDVLEGSDGGR